MKFYIPHCSKIIFSALVVSLSATFLFGQGHNFSGTKVIVKNGQTAMQTIPSENMSVREPLDGHLSGLHSSSKGKPYVLGGNVLWWTDDQGTAAIANTVALNDAGDAALTAWTLNSMRAALYSDANNTPLWTFPTDPNDPVIDISGDGSVIGAIAGSDFYLLDNATGNIDFQFTLPDSLVASALSVSRDGSMAVVCANASGGSGTARAYAFDLSGGTPTVAWTLDVPDSAITNWAGVNIAASGSTIALAGRYHLYMVNSGDGTVIWDRFLDNTESAPAISGDGSVVATADNSGFVHTWVYDQTNSEYDLLWKYRVPVGQSTNWASSVGISADGSVILAGTLIFLSSGYDGSVIAFDTFGGGTPKWVFGGVGDLVDAVAVSDDGKVAATATWGDLAHTLPDLLVFDVATGQVTFNVVTPGSFFTCDISADGKRVFAGGKAVHAREFGNGGRIYLSEIDLGGGNVSGTVDLTDTGDDSGVLVTAEGTVRSAVTDASGNYMIRNIPGGTYTISAEKPGYDFGEVTNISVTEGDTTSGVNFSLAPFSQQPPTLSASTGLVGEIMLNWTSLVSNPGREKEIARMVGDDLSAPDSPAATKLVGKSNSIEPLQFPNHLEFPADSIAVYRAPVSGGPYNWIASVPSSLTSYTDSTVFPLKDYYYVVTLFNDTGESAYSNEALGQVSDTLLTFSIDAPQASIPTIDGVLSTGEWDDAMKIDISDLYGYGGGTPIPQGSVYMYFKFDDNTDMLYVAGEDFLNPTLDDNEGFGLYFDDNNDGVFNATPPFILEGNFWAYWHPGGSDLRFRQIPSYAITTLAGAEVEFSDINGHLQGEVAIPMGFVEGYQLQVFGPDKITGLGAFIIARQAGAAIFNGWWPQTMNTVFNPLYFGDVGIDASFIAPPQAPSNVSVAKQGNDLQLTWNDPTLGLNGDPLPVTPTINIYRNGEYFTSVSAGVQSLLDTDVHCTSWYEYQLEASIQVDTLLLTGPISESTGTFACSDPALSPISYDDGVWDGFYVASFSWENNKFGIRFTPTSYPVTVRRLMTTVNSDDDFDFTVQIDDDGLPGDTIAGPYTVYGENPSGTVSTISKTLPGLDPPEITAGDFWVVINWHEDTPGSPGIGADIDPPIDGRSFYYLTSTGWVSLPTVDIMVTTYVSSEPVSVEETGNGLLPLTFDLHQNYPNPFNPTTSMSYQVPRQSEVRIEVYNLLGQKVRTLFNGHREPGYFRAVWDGRNESGVQVGSGVYVARMVAGDFTRVRKMILMK